MRFEKLNEDKIRITLNHEDLEKKDIDFHTFMSNSLESQDLFFDMLEEAEREIGFITKDYLIRIEALAMSGGNFVLTITRTLPEKNRTTSRKKIHIKRKKIDTEATQFVYLFSTFDDYCAFVNFLKNNNFKITNLAETILLYNYKNGYYLVINNINPCYPKLKKLLSSITEFSSFVNNSELFERRLSESGKLIMKNNALKLSIKHFAQ